MNYIILDLEWNQSPPGHTTYSSLEFEIIEFGAVKVDERGEILDEFHSFVSPKVYHRMHYKAKEITGITIKELKKLGKPFYMVVRDFFKWCGEDYMFATWGDMDLTELQKNCDYYGFNKYLSFPLLFLDLQKLYSLQYGDGKKRLSLKAAVLERELPIDEEFHSAISDARYTAKLFKLIDIGEYGLYYSIDYHRLPKTPEEEVYLNFKTYGKYVSREFASKEEAFTDKRVNSTNCFMCGKPRTKKIRWFTYNGHSFYSVANCPVHGLCKSKIRIKKGRSGGIFVVKTEKLTTEAKMLELKAKQREVAKKKLKKKKQLAKQK